MTNPDHATLPNDSADLQPTAESRAQALNRLREAENERLGEEQIIRKRIMWLGIVVGATVGLTIGYMGTLITIVDTGIGEFGFNFFRPNFVDGFLRIISAYLIGGGAVGGVLSYLLFTTRTEASSPIRWLIAGIFYALATPLIIGFLLPTTILIFGDFIEGLRPGLWLSAFVETLLGSFLDGYIFMVKILAAGWTGTLMFLAIFIGAYAVSQKMTLPETITQRVPAVVAYNIAAAVIALIPLIILAFGPFSFTTAVASFLTGEKL